MNVNSNARNKNSSLYLKGEWAERFAVLTKVWNLSPEYQELCSSQFLVRSTNSYFGLHSYQDANDFERCKLQIGSTVYTLEYINCSDTWLMDQTGNIELILSCRTCSFRDFAVAIVQPRYEGLSDEKYYALREVGTK